MSLAHARLSVLSVLSLAFAAAAEAATPPALGDAAPPFALQTVDGQTVDLAQLRKNGPVVLVVLRGYPGYQCPVCNAQVGKFLAGAERLAAAKASVVLVYPGEAKDLKTHAREFLRGKMLPKHVSLVIDPDYGFTNAYGLRWNAKNETAYPATFVIGTDGKVQFAKVSQTHGGRASLEEVLAALKP